MADESGTSSYVTPSAIVTALLGFLCGAAALAYNPFFATSVIAVVLSVVTLRNAAGIRNYIVQGLLRIFGIIGIMAGLGGAVALAYPGLGVTG